MSLQNVVCHCEVSNEEATEVVHLFKKLKNIKKVLCILMVYEISESIMFLFHITKYSFLHLSPFPSMFVSPFSPPYSAVAVSAVCVAANTHGWPGEGVDSLPRLST